MNMRGWALLCALFWPCLCASQQCNPAVAATTPAARFQAHPDGTLTDRQSGLRWARCSVGQRWDGAGCSGIARRVTWSEAQTLARDGWRLPDIKELSSLTELRCAHPAINETLFPATPAADFWTATPFINQPGQQWRVQFIYGESHPDKRSIPAYLRLVKDAG